jgi:probable HAF family extracellular repeat protein
LLLVVSVASAFGIVAVPSAIAVSQAGALSVSPAQLSFAAAEGQLTAPQQVTVSSTSKARLKWTATTSVSWLNVAPVAGTGTGIVDVSASALGLAPATYRGTVRVDAGTAGSQSVDVTFTVRDVTAPAVSLSAPAAGATLSATVAVSADASDNVAVAGVRFELDGALLGAEDATAPYSLLWDTTGALNGNHTLRALARDAAGNEAGSLPVTVDVQNIVPDPPPDPATAVITGKPSDPSSLTSALFSFRAGPAPTPPAYALTELVPGGESRATAINDAGQAVGWARVGDAYHAMLWSGGTARDLGTLGGQNSYAYGIDEAGVVVGAAERGDGLLRAVRWTNGVIEDLGHPGVLDGSTAVAINGSGEILANSNGRAFLYSGGTWSEFAGGPAVDMNDAGLTLFGAGMLSTGPGGSSRDLWHLGLVGTTAAFALDNAGRPVGRSAVLSGAYHAFLYDGTMFDLGGSLGFERSWALAINDIGQVVGEGQFADVIHLFLYTGGVAYDVNNLVPAGSGWMLGSVGMTDDLSSAPPAINNKGQIVVNVLTQGLWHALLLTPAKAPPAETASFECKLDAALFEPCKSPKGFGAQVPAGDAGRLADGSHTFSIRATDAVGNVGPVASYSWTVDTQGPTVAITAKPADPTNSTNATFAFSSEPGASLECRRDFAAWGSCASPKTYPGPLADGQHTFSARATDSLGNVGPEASHVWSIDTVAPAVAIAEKPTDPTTSTSASFAFSSEAGASVECKLDGGAFAACVSPTSYAGPLADGAHTFSVRAVDAVGNVGLASHAWTIDTHGPTVAITAKPADPTISTSATFEFASESGATFECKLDDALFQSCTSPKSYGPLTVGSHTFAVRGTDGLANLGAAASYTWAVTSSSCPCSLLSPLSQPERQNLPTQDGRTGQTSYSYELGVKVKVDVRTNVTAVRFFKSSEETGSHASTLWTATGVKLATVPFTSETASGWQRQELATPYLLEAGVVYVVSVNANARFGLTSFGLANELVSGPLRSVADGQNGVFGDAAGVFPTKSYQSSNYFTDVEVIEDGAPPPAPNVTSTSPADGATGVSPSAQVRASFSRPLDPASVTASTFTLQAGTAAPVVATVAYDQAADTATLTPSVALTAGTVYTARLDTAVRSADGVPLASAVTWSFTVAAAAPGTGNAFKRVVVGPGFVDATTRQVIRTADDRVYVFAADDTPALKGTGPGVVHAYRADQVGIPTSFTEVDAANRPTAFATAKIAGVDVRLDRNGVAHAVYVDNYFQTELVYRTFSTVTDTWGPAEALATGLGDQPRGSIKFALALDGLDNPHVVYVKGASVLLTARQGGTWSSPTTFWSGGASVHPSLAFDALGNMHALWLDDGTAPVIRYRRRNADGFWTDIEEVAAADVLSNSKFDQGPSIAVTAGGRVYVVYVGAPPASAVRVKYRTDSGWVSDSPPTDLFTHTPQIYTRGDDVYAFLGHDVNINFGYTYRLAGQPWSGSTALSTERDDGSASIRWDPLRETNPDVIDASFFDEDTLGNGSFLPEVYYMAVVPSGGTP